MAAALFAALTLMAAPPAVVAPMPMAVRHPRLGTFVRDVRKVVSIDPALGQAVLDYRGRQIRAFWQTEIYQAREGMVAQPDRLKTAVGEYREPVASVQTFDAGPGDTIEFQGMWMGNDVFLRGIAKVAGP